LFRGAACPAATGFSAGRKSNCPSEPALPGFFLVIFKETELFEMVKNADHVTLVVRDVEDAKKFFAILGFIDEIDTVISGEVLSTYMGIKNIEAQHVTLVLQGCTPRFEVQLLHYINPPIFKDPNTTDLRRTGYNHLALRVENLESEVKRLKEAGFVIKNQPVAFNDRKLVFIVGPEDVTIELVEWLD
jgi:catechol 2,3-dioxygenase-like lactoylglutathione lyase family enzyme